MAKATHAVQISDTVEFRHHQLTQPEVTPMDRIVHGVNKLTCNLQDAPQIAWYNQLFFINALKQAFQRWKTSNTSPRAQPPWATTLHPHARLLSILRPMRRPREDRPPRATSKGVHSKATGHPNTAHTHHKSRRTHCTAHAVPLTSHGPGTSKGAQNN